MLGRIRNEQPVSYVFTYKKTTGPALTLLLRLNVFRVLLYEVRHFLVSQRTLFCAYHPSSECLPSAVPSCERDDVTGNILTATAVFLPPQRPMWAGRYTQ